MLTGCDTEEVFGKTGEYVLKLGEDVFGTGHQGVTGGEEGTEPQSNDETHIFHNYDVKKVEKAPKEEKVAYSFAGPENAGITPTQPPVAATVQPNSPASNVNTGTLVVITAGHCVSQQSKLEFLAKETYTKFIYKMLDISGNLNEREWAVNAFRFGKAVKSFYKAATGKKLSSGKDGAEKLTKLYTDLKWVKAKKGGGFKCIPTEQKAAEYYNKNSKIAKKVEGYINKGAASELRSWFEETNVVPIGDGNIEGNVLLKKRAESGASYGGKAEHTINFEYAKALHKQLTKKGYNVVLGRTSDSTAKMADDSMYFSNANIARFGNKQKATVHFVIHWDSTTGGGKGIHCIYGNNWSPGAKHDPCYGIFDAMRKKDKNKKYFQKPTPNKGSDYYTTLNWSDVPTLIVECGYLTDEDYGACGKDANKWVKERLALFEAGIKQAEKGATN